MLLHCTCLLHSGLSTAVCVLPLTCCFDMSPLCLALVILILAHICSSALVYIIAVVFDLNCAFEAGCVHIVFDTVAHYCLGFGAAVL